MARVGFLTQAVLVAKRAFQQIQKHGGELERTLERLKLVYLRTPLGGLVVVVVHLARRR